VAPTRAAPTTPELIKRWWSGDRGEVTIVEVDLRVGGTWRYVMTANGGLEVAFHGEYREIVPNERIVSAEIYEGMPEGEARLRHGRRHAGSDGPRAGRGVAPLTRISGGGAPGFRRIGSRLAG
jgi:uncharacterized protein YndB with AHSA1/START domain